MPNFAKNQKGAAALIVSLVLLSLAIIFIPTAAFLTQVKQELIQNQLKAVHAYYAAEGAIEDNIYRIKKGMKYSDVNSLDVDGSPATINITTSGSEKIITVQSEAAGRHRKVEAVLAIDGVLADFSYGVQAGQGGLNMNQSAKVEGNVYSNGSIIGFNSAQITGDAYAASSSFISGMIIGGNARAYSISISEVGGNATMADLLDDTLVMCNAYAARITKSKISGNATYITIDQYSYDRVGGQKIATTTAPATLPVQPFAISDAQLDAWENEAQNGGPPITSPCPYEISSSRNLGPVKINCDLIVSGNSTILTVNGLIWVKGDITVRISAQIKLAGYFGANSSVIIADDPDNRLNKGRIQIFQGSQILGSGATRSYLLAVSRNNSAASGGAVIAIEPRNSSASGIFFAPYGSIDLQQSVSLKELTAYKIIMSNSAIVSYESGLANLLFTSGPTAGWTLTDWQEKL
ncbi:MAG: hypothetical protein Q8L57_02080 [bacterium]|nr:hypothetical protein [bacterium]